MRVERPTIQSVFRTSVETSSDSQSGGPMAEPVSAIPRELRVGARGVLAYLQERRGVECLVFRDLEGGRERLCIKPSDLPLQWQWGTGLSDEERARRERLRLASSGISEFSLSQLGTKAVFACEGELFFVDLEQSNQPVPLDTGMGFHNEARLSPDGRHAAYLRGQNLYVYDFSQGVEQLVAGADESTVSYGRADFIAQEELDRMEGYWWSPRGDFLAFTRVDVSPIPEYVRPKLGAGGRVEVVEDRYPFAGGPNASVSLCVASREGGGVLRLNISADSYLARVNWLRNGKGFFYQELSRDQRRLTLWQVELDTGQCWKVLEETSSTWVNLHDDLVPLEGGGFVWSSERTGFRHLYLYNERGEWVRQLTSGDWPVRRLCGVDQERGMVYFLASPHDPTEQHLYTVSLEGEPPIRLTFDEGWHSAVVAAEVGRIVHRFEGLSHEPGLYLQSLPFRPIKEVPCLAGKSRKVAKVAEVVFGCFKGPGGVDLCYRLAVPKNFDGTKLYPAVVEVYGGPHAQVVTKRQRGGLSIRAKTLIQKGFVIFSVDNRGSTNRGVAFEGCLKGQFGRVEVEDQVAGVRFLKNLPYIDEERVGVMGWSYGGYMVLKLLERHPHLFRAGVSVAPVTDWSLYDTGYTERYLGTPQENPEGYSRSGVLEGAGRIPSGKLLLMHGSGDDNVFYANTVAMKEALETQDVLFEEHSYVGKGHTMNDRQGHLCSTAVDFLQRRLLVNSTRT